MTVLPSSVTPASVPDPAPLSTADLLALLALRPVAASYRAWFRAQDRELGPLGDGDAKTAAPGTYRPVGPTCPATCPYLGAGCYAQGGNVRLHEQAARSRAVERQAAVNAAGAAIAWAHRTGRIARLHVSGDCAGPDGAVDVGYVAALAATAHTFRRLVGAAGPVAWTYTHLPYGAWVEDLRAAGIAVRLSDRASSDAEGPGAIVVRSREHARQRRAEIGSVAVCRAQIGPVSCSECRLCWTRPDLTIAFLPEGRSTAKIGAAIPVD